MIEKKPHRSPVFTHRQERQGSTAGRRILILCMCSGLFLVLGCVLHAASPGEKQPEAIIDQLNEADAPFDIVEAYRVLFADVSSQDLKRLAASVDDGVALAAAWQHVRRTMPKEPFEEVTPDPRALNRFLGRVEGRLRVALPRWWEEGMLDTRSRGRNHIWQVPEDHLSEWDRQVSEVGVLVWSGVTIRSMEHQWRVSRDGESILLPKDVARDGTGLEIRFVGNRCYVAAHGSTGSPYSLYCFDRKDGDLLWETTVWGTGGLGFGSGIFEHWVEIMPVSDHVLLFGLSNLGAYIEGFDPETGENKFRFGTRYFEF